MRKVIATERRFTVRRYTIAGGLLALFGASGCSGFELGAKAGLYRVDERQESQRTYRAAVPLKCYFVNCESSAADSEASGS